MDTERTTTMLRPGTLIADRFRLVAPVGSGGMGVVFRAVDEGSGAAVAVKVLQHISANALARFDREAESLAALSHPAVVRYVAHGTHDDLPFLVMEWLDGEPLDRALERGALSVADALVVARRLAEGLGAAHRVGLVHRDIKPGNVVLVHGRCDGATLVDFGLARLTVDPRDVTLTGSILGTPGYMAPELARGAPATPAADVFAVGCVLFEMLTAERAFGGKTAFEALAKVLLDEPPKLDTLRDELPLGMQPLLDRLLAKSAAERPADGAALAQLLAAQDVPGESAPAPPPSRSRRFLPVPAAIAWGALADSDRWERITGAPPSSYEATEVTTDGGLVRRRVGSAVLFAMPMRWVEVGEWVEGAWAWGERRFTEGPFERMGLRFRVEPRDGGCEVTVESYAELREGTVQGARDLVLGTFRRRMERYLDALARALSNARAGDRGERSPLEVAGEIVLAQPHDDLLHGRVASWGDAQAALERLAGESGGDEARERVHAFLRAASDEQLRFVRPYELARALRLDRRVTLLALLEAAHAGVLELVWSLACPTCRSRASSEGALAAVAAHARCAVCQVDFEVDLARNVELGMRRPGVDPDNATYCESSPAFRPHVIACLGLGARQTRIEAVPLPAGRVKLRRVGPAAGETCVDLGQTPPTGLRVTITSEALRVVDERHAEDEGALRGFSLVSLDNATDDALEVTIEREGPTVSGVRGLDVLTLAEFVRLFADELPRDGVSLSVGAAATAALQLCGVESLCDEVGVERAATWARDALEAFAAATQTHGGTVSSEAGVTAIASFADIDDAERAAHEAVAAIAATGAAQGLTARATVAAGPMIARRRGSSLVLFGKPLLRVQGALERTAPGVVHRAPLDAADR